MLFYCDILTNIFNNETFFIKRQVLNLFSSSSQRILCNRKVNVLVLKIFEIQLYTK